MHLPEPMTRFRCNEMGCCCFGWSLPFDPDDVVDLMQVLPEEERSTLLRGARIRADGETGIARTIQLRQLGREGRCRYLRDDSRCRIHAEHGASVIPHLCRAFPSAAYRVDGGVDLDWDVICPEVLARIDESDGPLEIVAIDPAPGTDLAARAERPVDLPEMAIAGRSVSASELGELRQVLIDALNSRASRGLPAIDVLAHIAWAFKRFHAGSPFALDAADPLPPSARRAAWANAASLPMVAAALDACCCLVGGGILKH